MVLGTEQKLTRAGRRCRAILLTNPNLDLTLRHFDETRGTQPNPSTMRRAVDAWCGETPPNFVPQGREFPPTCIVTSRNDPLLPETLAFAAAAPETGVRIIDAPGHGFVSSQQWAAVTAAYFAHFTPL